MAVSGLSIVGPERGTGSPLRSGNEMRTQTVALVNALLVAACLGFGRSRLGFRITGSISILPGRTIIGTRNAMNLFPMIETAISSHSRVPHNPQRSNFAWVARLCAVDWRYVLIGFMRIGISSPAFLSQSIRPMRSDYPSSL